MDEEFVIQNEPPWVVEIEGVKFVAPEMVCLLLQDVSEERDQLETENERLREAINKALSAESPSVTEIVTDWDTRVARSILSDALKEDEWQRGAQEDMIKDEH